MMNFEIKNENGVLTGILNGRLDSAIANQLEKDMQPLMDSADKDIVLDCTGLEYISSSGLAAVPCLAQGGGKEGGHLGP
ncbi:MAG: STAS domain-containing protein [Bacteroides cellulosilyticus]